ncbi:LysR family transcriptional regulator [Vibrio anguillarum]|nr:MULTISPECIES: LysR family transcriptional regulator [Vibrio]NAW90751.1 LysR family transcriptional regulator [Vibrio sp. V24_P1S3T111]AQP36213.1 LysR family transcriptional regulator [Vibrio anguillarum]MBF4423258.1 LysR family transcriptional regulator [Vibrio anguillarum]MCC4237115.1 LysR family transcriptional regulator [Vibrio anguillarum]MDQ2189518.1 LysR family transcriptional regulator [Vibrio sp. A14(2019)]
MNKLLNMEVFVAIVEQQGLAAAAKAINMSAASVTLKLQELERHYGVKLLQRTTRKIALTEAGERFYPLCLQTLANITEVESSLFAEKTHLEGNIKISAPKDLGRQHLLPLLDSFLARHPKIVPQITFSDSVLGIYETKLDLVLRYGTLKDSQLVSRKLATSRRVLCASPAYLACHGQPTHPEDLKQHACLGMLRKSESLTRWSFLKGDVVQDILIKPSRLSNDGEVIRQWALEGAGIALKSQLDIQPDLNAGKLVLLLEDYRQSFSSHDLATGSDLHLLYPNRDHQPSRIKILIEEIVRYFEKRTLPTGQ